MAWSILARLLFTGAVAYTAFLLRPLGAPPLLDALFGAALALLAVAFEWRLRETPITNILGALLGGAIGLGIAKGIGAALFWADTSNGAVAFLHGFVLLALTYLGLVIGGRKGEWLQPARLAGLFRAAGPERHYKILDTSVIIDGRVADICETRIIDSPLIIPRFVLQELQTIADSSDKLKRNRGRRGLDMLNKLQTNDKVEIKISDARLPSIEESGDVDQKLVALAKKIDGRVVTNDYNLNKIAQLRGVDVININDLANALKPVVLPGEAIVVKIIKPGEEMGQGVGYLEDGTMVVAESSRDRINEEVSLTVTSVLQTSAGRMIFGRPEGLPPSPRRPARRIPGPEQRV